MIIQTANIISRFGGPSKVAEICEITVSAVCQWGGVIPARHHPALIAAAPSLGVELQHSDFYKPQKPRRNISRGEHVAV